MINPEALDAYLAAAQKDSPAEYTAPVARKRQRFSDVLSEAVDHALDVYRDTCESELFGDVNAATWRAMYEAQCSATDEFSKRATARTDKALTARIAELEAQIAAVNRSFENINYGQFVLLEHARALTDRINECSADVPQIIRKNSDALSRAMEAVKKTDSAGHSDSTTPK